METEAVYAKLGRWAAFIYNYLPSSAWGIVRRTTWKGLRNHD